MGVPRRLKSSLYDLPTAPQSFPGPVLLCEGSRRNEAVRSDSTGIQNVGESIGCTIPSNTSPRGESTGTLPPVLAIKGSQYRSKRHMCSSCSTSTSTTAFPEAHLWSEGWVLVLGPAGHPGDYPFGDDPASEELQRVQSFDPQTGRLSLQLAKEQLEFG